MRVLAIVTITAVVMVAALEPAHADDGSGSGSGSGAGSGAGSGSAVTPAGTPVDPDAGPPVLGPDGKPIVTPGGAVVVAPDKAPVATATAGDTDLHWSYLWDGGIVPFYWGAGAGVIALMFVKPPLKPRLFSEDEGGHPKSSWEVPGWSISALGVGLTLAMVITGNPSRWYHVKGMGEALVTGALMTSILKVTMGRHRPDWVPTDPRGASKSFPSGHATQAFSIATYTILYLRFHAFNNYRADNTILWWEVGLDLAILGAASAFTAERVVHNRHFKTDILVGGLLGTLSSVVFFTYQERRYRRRHGNPNPVQVIPKIASDSVGLQLGWTF
jgi:membrane-associated phospholipid phosphatase